MQRYFNENLCLNLKDVSFISIIILLTALIFLCLFFPNIVLTSILFLPTILGLWIAQSVIANIAFYGYVLPNYDRYGIIYYIVGWVVVAFHEFSHAIVLLVTRAKIKEMLITPEEGHVKYVHEIHSAASVWLSEILSSLAPCFFTPLILLGIAHLFGFTLDLTNPDFDSSITLQFVIYIAITNLARFIFWIFSNLLNPMLYVFLFIYTTFSLGAGSSSVDWKCIPKTMVGMPLHTLVAILGSLLILSAISIINYSFITILYGFWLFLSFWTILGQLTAALIAKLFTST